jgi:hypothetical protein
VTSIGGELQDRSATDVIQGIYRRRSCTVGFCFVELNGLSARLTEKQRR